MLCSVWCLWVPKSESLQWLYIFLVLCIQIIYRRIWLVQNPKLWQEPGNKRFWVQSQSPAAIPLNHPWDMVCCPLSSGIVGGNFPQHFCVSTSNPRWIPHGTRRRESGKSNEQRISKANCFLSTKGLILLALTCFLQCKGVTDVWIRAIYAHLKNFMICN